MPRRVSASARRQSAQSNWLSGVLVLLVAGAASTPSDVSDRGDERRRSASWSTARSLRATCSASVADAARAPAEPGLGGVTNQGQNVGSKLSVSYETRQPISSPSLGG